MARRVGGALVALAMAGCSTTPDVTLSYYPATAATTVLVTQTIDCDDKKTQVFTVETVKVDTLYGSDRTQAPRAVRITRLNRWYADGEIKATWFDDGRLKSINQSTVGQGEAFLKAAVALAVAFTPAGGSSPSADEAAKAKKACEEISAFGHTKPVTLTYVADIRYRQDGAVEKAVDGSGPEFRLSHAGMEPFVGRIRDQLPRLQVRISDPKPSKVVEGQVGSDDVPVELFRIAYSEVSVLRKGAPIYKGLVTVPTGEIYTLPVPRAALFGKQGFELTLNDAGQVVSLGYSMTSGAAGAVNSVAALEGTEAARANQLKAEADLIFQQQRLLRCQTQPDKCT